MIWIGAYFIVLAWGSLLLVAVERTDNTWPALWRVLYQPPAPRIPRAVAQQRKTSRS